MGMISKCASRSFDIRIATNVGSRVNTMPIAVNAMRLSQRPAMMLVNEGYDDECRDHWQEVVREYIHPEA